GDHARVVEKRDILGSIKIEPQETELVQVSVQITCVLCRILSAAGRSPVSISPVVFYETAATPESRLPIDARRRLRCELLLRRNVTGGVARPYVHLKEGSGKARAKMAERGDSGLHFDGRVF